MDIMLCFQKDDAEFERLIKDAFGDNIDFVLTSDLDGKQFFSVVIKYSKTLVAFLKKYVDSSEKKRFIRTKSGNLYFQNYTADEIVKILEALNDE